MLFNDLKEMNTNPRAKERVVKKAKTEMVYYLTIKEMLRKYGVDYARYQDGSPNFRTGSKDIAVMNFDAIGCVRDQMAMAGSASKAVQYNSDGDVVRFDLDALIRSSITDSESLLKLVQSRIATESSEAIDSDDLYELAIQKLQEELDPDNDNSVFSVVRERVRDFEYSEAEKTYGMYGVGADKDTIVNLPLSPLMPEFAKVDKLTKLDAGYASRSRMNVFNVYQKYTKGRAGGNVAYAYGESNDILYKYDASKGILTDGFRYSLGSKSKSSMRVKAVTNVVVDYDEFAKHNDLTFATTLNNVRDGFVDKFAIAIYNTIVNNTQQELSDKDLNMIQRLASDLLVNMHGDPENGLDSLYLTSNLAELRRKGYTQADYFKETCEKLDRYIVDYTSYLDDVCKTMQDNIHHHEFQIHFEDVTSKYAISDDRSSGNSGRNSVIAMYASGDSRGNDYNVAKNQESRFFGVVVSARYSGRVNSDIQPAFGDIIGAGYEAYTVGDVEQHSRIEANIARGVDAVYRARKFLMDYDRGNVRNSTIIRQSSDVEKYVNDDGTIDAKYLIKTLRDNRNTISRNMNKKFVNDLKEVKARWFLAIRSSEYQTIDIDDVKSSIRSIIQDISIEKFESQINDQIVFKHLHDNFLKEVDKNLESLRDITDPDEFREELIRVVEMIDNQRISTNSCHELFGTGNVICIDKCCQYSDIAYINQIVQLASNLKQCIYVDNASKAPTSRSTSSNLYFTVFNAQSFEEDDALSDSINDEYENDDPNAIAEDIDENTDAVSDTIYKSMFLDMSDEDITWKWLSSNERDAVIYRETHPLQYAVFQEIRSSLLTDDIKMTSGGIIYHANDSEIRFKVGPIIDEEAFILPILDDGTRTSEIVVDGGHLKNQVKFGALDLKGVGNASVNNRIYGFSGKVGSYDGYDYDRQFTDRVDLSTYQMGVMDEVRKCLTLHKIAFEGERYNRGKDGYSLKKNIYMYYQHNFISNVYNTGTYIIENKEKAEMASRYLHNLTYNAANGDSLKDPLDGIVDLSDSSEVWDEVFVTPDYLVGLNNRIREAADRNPDEVTEEFKQEYKEFYRALVEDAVVRSVQTYLMQLDMDHSRCVMPKISLNQNIGLYNIALNLAQNNAARMTNLIDRKNLRDSDCKSRRFVGFQDNNKFDAKLTGSAKRLGAIMYLAEDTVVDIMTGRIYPGDGHYSTIINSGIKDVYGDVVAPVVEYNGAQALDRIQLSVYAQLKGLTYVPDTKFAMVNLTDNMEDGYIITQRMANKLGHFEFDEKTGLLKYKTAIVGDKIGDSESGNKGIISRIIDTDMSKDDYIRSETKMFMTSHTVSHDGVFDNETIAAIRRVVNEVGIFNALEGLDESDKAYQDIRMIDMRDIINTIEFADNTDEIYSAIYEASVSGELNIPKYESYMGNRLTQFLLFKNNEDIDVAMTNVCVLTRSNPSLMLHIANAEENGKTFVIENGADGTQVETTGVIGSAMFYLDSHTGDDKNRTYGVYGAVKGGRSWGAQEMFAFDARKCNDDFVKLLIAQDKYIVSKIDKINRRLVMNGIYMDVSDDFKLKSISDGQFSIESLSETDRDLVNENGDPFFISSGIQVIDIKALAKLMLDQIDANLGQENKRAIAYPKNIINEELARGIFNSVLAPAKGESAEREQMTQSANNMINTWFTYMTSVPNVFLPIPDTMPSELFRVYYGDKFVRSDEITIEPIDIEDRWDTDDYDDEYYDDGELFADYEESTYVRVPGWQRRIDSLMSKYNVANSLVFNIDGTRNLPLFIGAENNVNLDSDAQDVSKIKIKTQLDMFKTMLAYSVLEEIENRHDRIQEYGSLSESISDAKEKLMARMVGACAGISTDNSLSLNELNQKFKSDIYRFTISDSYTAVWSGDGGTLNLNQVGISFEMAKEMRLIHTKEKNLKYPDTFENMILNGYTEINDDALVFVNRSPGQTTGCMRGLHPVIINNDSRSIKIHPAIATVFDGDFDGDTVGVIHIPKTKAIASIYDAAMTEASRTMTLETNVIKSAENKVVKALDGHEIPYINPLFIAGNADIGIGLYYAQQERDKAGYDVKISDEIDEITIRANLLEQYKQLANDLESNLIFGDTEGSDNLGMLVYTPTIIAERLKHIEEIASYSDDMKQFNEQLKSGECKALCDVIKDYQKAVKATERRHSKEIDEFKALDADTRVNISPCSFACDSKLTDFIKTMRDSSAAAIDSVRGSIYELEVVNYEHLNDVYTEAMKVANGKCYTAGGSDYEKIEKVVNEANISRKGKAPQLNALLKYAGLSDTLKVAKDKESGKFMMFNADGSSITPEQRTEYCETLRMDVTKSKADVPVSAYRNEAQSNMSSQACKSDATGLGGAVAQKMQKFMASYGYSEVALKISGPITQRYLDAKQNVAACEINLTVGKYVLDDVIGFREVKELNNENFQRYESGKTRNGQFTATGSPVTISEGVDQINNIIKMFDLTSDGLEALSPVDMAIVKACASKVVGASGDYEKIPVTDFAKRCGEHNNQAYNIMYNSNAPSTLMSMADAGESIFRDTMISNARSELAIKIDDKRNDSRNQTLINDSAELTSIMESFVSEEKEAETEQARVVTIAQDSHRVLVQNTANNSRQNGRGRGQRPGMQRSPQVEMKMGQFIANNTTPKSDGGDGKKSGDRTFDD